MIVRIMNWWNVLSCSKLSGDTFALVCVPRAIQHLPPSGPWGAWQALRDVGGPTWSLIGGECDGPATLSS